MAIRYKINVLDALKHAGYSTYKIRREKLFNEYTMQQIREGKMVNLNIIERICSILNIQPGDILEYISDDDNSQMDEGGASNAN